MRILHTADLHIGYRAFERLTRDGLNARECDVAASFGRMIDRAIELEPDVVIVAGDTFHFAKPTPFATVTAFTGFQRLMAALPDVIAVAIGGNHDLGRAAENGGILPLFASLGIHVVERASQRLWFPERDLSILGVPDAPGLARPSLTRDPRARHNVLVMHGEAQGMPRQGGQPASEITLDEIGVEAWDYIGLGHFHSYQQIAPNCWYSGSIDLTSSNPWSELHVSKGFAVQDLDTGAHTFHELPASRRFLDLAAIDATGLGAAELDDAIRTATEARDIAGAVVRLVVTNVTKEVGRALNQKAIREYKHRALNFNLALERPEHVESALSMMVRGVTVPGARAKTVDERVEHHLTEIELPSDVDRGALLALGKHYMDQARDKDSTVAIIEPSTSSSTPTDDLFAPVRVAQARAS